MSDPTLKVDPLLTEFFVSATFGRLAETTQISYTNDYRVLFDFLWGRGKTWTQATTDDLEDFEDWRRRAPTNPHTIGGSKWMRELAAFKRLFDWALSSELVLKPSVDDSVRGYPVGRCYRSARSDDKGCSQRECEMAHTRSISTLAGRGVARLHGCWFGRFVLAWTEFR
ncbi:site-specific integrase [Cryobacterium breve]|uniref:Site-specific integrase n=1 Tax=Cryobacterium breve TaxID=1259258 RepID=A0ABY7NI20_9MICO|nr:site-specific integrase [Cryobacterium breve]